MKRYFLTDRQRSAILDYLENRPNKMPSYVRQLRMYGKKLDYPQIRRDLILLETLANLEVKIGRKEKGWKDLHGTVQIRQKDSRDQRAVFRVKR